MFLQDVKAIQAIGPDQYNVRRKDYNPVEGFSTDELYGVLRYDKYLFKRPKETWSEEEIVVAFEEKTNYTGRDVPCKIVYKVERHDDYLLKLTKQK